MTGMMVERPHGLRRWRYPAVGLGRELTQELVREHGKTVGAVTHDLDMAARMDRRIQLVDGRINRIN